MGQIGFSLRSLGLRRVNAVQLLLEEDYQVLKNYGISYAEDLAQRILVLKGYPLPGDVYQQTSCDVLLVVPSNYNQSGNDMLWTNPRLVRKDGKPIPATNEYGGADSRHFEGLEFCRWSRHWNAGDARWRPGVDGVETMFRRVEWALKNPDANK